VKSGIIYFDTPKDIRLTVFCLVLALPVIINPWFLSGGCPNKDKMCVKIKNVNKRTYVLSIVRRRCFSSVVDESRISLSILRKRIPCSKEQSHVLLCLETKDEEMMSTITRPEVMNTCLPKTKIVFKSNVFFSHQLCCCVTKKSKPCPTEKIGNRNTEDSH